MHDSSDVFSCLSRIGSSRGRLLLGLFALLFVSYGYFYQSGQHNECVRFDQTRAMAEEARCDIGSISYNSADIITLDGKTFNSKAPGLSLFAVPHWLLLNKLLRALHVPDRLHYHFVTYFTSWLTVGLFSAIAGVLVFVVVDILVKSAEIALWIALAYGLGTIVFPFSTCFFGHQFAAALLFMGFSILFGLKRARERRIFLPLWLEHGLALGAGLSAGFSVTTEFPLILGVVPLGIYAVYALRRPGLLAVCALGVLGGIAILAAYNLWAFGKLFYVSYAAYANDPAAAFSAHKKGLLGVTLPSMEILLKILFGSQRGLFFLNPWLLLVLPGFLVPVLFKRFRAEMVYCVYMVTSFVLFNAGYGDSIVYWGGGASTGPRHVIPMLPFAAVLVAQVIRFVPFARIFFCPAVLASVAMMLVATAVEPRMPYDFQNPIKDFAWNHYMRGELALERGGVFGGALLTQDSVAFNWGKLVGLPGCWQLVPLLVGWLAGFVWLMRAAVPRRGGLGRAARKWIVSSAVVGVFLLFLAMVPVRFAQEQASNLKGSKGLLGTYYEGLIWKDPPPTEPDSRTSGVRILRQEVNENLTFNWASDGPPLPGQISVEWRGSLIAPEAGVYRLGTESDDGSAVYIHGQLVSVNWGSHAFRVATQEVQLNKGPNPMTVIYYNDFGGAAMRLLWAPPGRAIEPVPSDAITPQRER